MVSSSLDLPLLEGRPSLIPAKFLACNASLVRKLISSRSICATSANIVLVTVEAIELVHSKHPV